MITIPVVPSCPHTMTGKGVLRLEHSVIAMLAGAVYDRNEWIALLIGTRSEDGLEITVDDLRIPLQERGYASCELVREEPIENGVVGVIHSHHNMTAFFSQTDDTQLNPRFPVSLVIAQVTGQSNESENLLGFNYKAEGRAPLPCGGIGIIDFTVLPHPLIPEWPVNVTPGYVEPNTAGSLYYCPFVETKVEGLIQHCSTKCGITTTEKARTVFGRNGKDFLKEVESKTRRYQQVQQGTNGYTYPIVVDNRKYFQNREEYGAYEQDSAFLRHWGTVEY